MTSRLGQAAPALAWYVAVRVLVLGVLAAWSAAAGRDAHRLLVSWDAQWYKGIAENGYGFVRMHPDGRELADYAFFPLFPGLERLVSEATGLAVVDAGLMISALSSVVAAWGIFAIGDHLHGRRVATVLVVLWAALPIGIVTSMAYSESLFTAAAAWSLYAVLTRHWIWAGSLAALAGLTRPVGAAVVAAVLVAAVVALLGDTGPGRRTRVVVGAAIAPLGLVGYVGWVGVRTGSPLGYFEVAGDWGNSLDGGRALARWVGDLFTGGQAVSGLLVCAGVAALIGLFLLGVRQGQPLPLLVFTGVLVLLALATSGYFGSKPRYLLPAFPLLLPLAVPLSRLRPGVVAGILGLLAAGASAYGAVWLLGPGPP